MDGWMDGWGPPHPIIILILILFIHSFILIFHCIPFIILTLSSHYLHFKGSLIILIVFLNIPQVLKSMYVHSRIYAQQVPNLMNGGVAIYVSSKLASIMSLVRVSFIRWGLDIHVLEESFRGNCPKVFLRWLSNIDLQQHHLHLWDQYKQCPRFGCHWSQHPWCWQRKPHGHLQCHH